MMRRIGLLLLVILLVESCVAQPDLCSTLSPPGFLDPGAPSCAQCGSTTVRVFIDGFVVQCCQPNLPNNYCPLTLSPPGFWISKGTQSSIPCSQCGGAFAVFSIQGVGKCCQPPKQQETECPVDRRSPGDCNLDGESNGAPPNRCYANKDCYNGLICCYDACLGQTCKNPVAAAAPDITLVDERIG